MTEKKQEADASSDSLLLTVENSSANRKEIPSSDSGSLLSVSLDSKHPSPAKTPTVAELKEKLKALEKENLLLDIAFLKFTYTALDIIKHYYQSLQDPRISEKFSEKNRKIFLTIALGKKGEADNKSLLAWMQYLHQRADKAFKKGFLASVPKDEVLIWVEKMKKISDARDDPRATASSFPSPRSRLIEIWTSLQYVKDHFQLYQDQYLTVDEKWRELSSIWLSMALKEEESPSEPTTGMADKVLFWQAIIENITQSIFKQTGINFGDTLLQQRIAIATRFNEFIIDIKKLIEEFPKIDELEKIPDQKRRTIFLKKAKDFRDVRNGYFQSLPVTVANFLKHEQIKAAKDLNEDGEFTSLLKDVKSNVNTLEKKDKDLKSVKQRKESSSTSFRPSSDEETQKYEELSIALEDAKKALVLYRNTKNTEACRDICKTISIDHASLVEEDKSLASPVVDFSAPIKRAGDIVKLKEKVITEKQKIKEERVKIQTAQEKLDRPGNSEQISRGLRQEKLTGKFKILESRAEINVLQNSRKELEADAKYYGIDEEKRKLELSRFKGITERSQLSLEDIRGMRDSKLDSINNDIENTLIKEREFSLKIQKKKKLLERKNRGWLVSSEKPEKDLITELRETLSASLAAQKNLWATTEYRIRAQYAFETEKLKEKSNRLEYQSTKMKNSLVAEERAIKACQNLDEEINQLEAILAQAHVFDEVRFKQAMQEWKRGKLTLPELELDLTCQTIAVLYAILQKQQQIANLVKKSKLDESQQAQFVELCLQVRRTENAINYLFDYTFGLYYKGSISDPHTNRKIYRGEITKAIGSIYKNQLLQRQMTNAPSLTPNQKRSLQTYLTEIQKLGGELEDLLPEYARLFSKLIKVVSESKEKLQKVSEVVNPSNFENGLPSFVTDKKLPGIHQLACFLGDLAQQLQQKTQSIELKEKKKSADTPEFALSEILAQFLKTIDELASIEEKNKAVMQKAIRKVIPSSLPTDDEKLVITAREETKESIVATPLSEPVLVKLPIAQEIPPGKVYHGPLDANQSQELVKRIWQVEETEEFSARNNQLSWQKYFKDFAYSLDKIFTQAAEAPIGNLSQALDQFLKETRDQLYDTESIRLNVPTVGEVRYFPDKDCNLILDPYKLFGCGISAARGLLLLIDYSEKYISQIKRKAALTELNTVLLRFHQEILASKNNNDKAGTALLNFHGDLVVIVTENGICSKKQAKKALLAARDFNHVMSYHERGFCRSIRPPRMLSEGLPHYSPESKESKPHARQEGVENGLMLRFSTSVQLDSDDWLDTQSAVAPEKDEKGSETKLKFFRSQQDNLQITNPWQNYQTRHWYAQNLKKLGPWYGHLLQAHEKLLRTLPVTPMDVISPAPRRASDITLLVVAPNQQIIHRSYSLLAAFPESFGIKNDKERFEVAKYVHAVTVLGRKGGMASYLPQLLFSDSPLSTGSTKQPEVTFLHQTYVGSHEDASKSSTKTKNKRKLKKTLHHYLKSHPFFVLPNRDIIRCSANEPKPEGAIPIKIRLKKSNNRINIWGNVPFSGKTEEDRQDTLAILYDIANRLKKLKLALPEHIAPAWERLLAFLEPETHYTSHDMVFLAAPTCPPKFTPPNKNSDLAEDIDQVCAHLLQAEDKTGLSPRQRRDLGLILQAAAEVRAIRAGVELRRHEHGYQPRLNLHEEIMLHILIKLTDGFSTLTCMSASDRADGEVQCGVEWQFLYAMLTCRLLVRGDKHTLKQAHQEGYVPAYLTGAAHDANWWSNMSPITKSAEMQGLITYRVKNNNIQKIALYSDLELRNQGVLSAFDTLVNQYWCEKLGFTRKFSYAKRKMIKYSKLEADSKVPEFKDYFLEMQSDENARGREGSLELLPLKVRNYSIALQAAPRQSVSKFNLDSGGASKPTVSTEPVTVPVFRRLISFIEAMANGNETNRSKAVAQRALAVATELKLACQQEKPEDSWANELFIPAIDKLVLLLESAEQYLVTIEQAKEFAGHVTPILEEILPAYRKGNEHQQSLVERIEQLQQTLADKQIPEAEIVETSSEEQEQKRIATAPVGQDDTFVFMRVMQQALVNNYKNFARLADTNSTGFIGSRVVMERSCWQAIAVAQKEAETALDKLKKKKKKKTTLADPACFSALTAITALAKTHLIEGMLATMAGQTVDQTFQPLLNLLVGLNGSLTLFYQTIQANFAQAPASKKRQKLVADLREITEQGQQILSQWLDAMASLNEENRYVYLSQIESPVLADAVFPSSSSQDEMDAKESKTWWKSVDFRSWFAKSASSDMSKPLLSETVASQDQPKQSYQSVDTPKIESTPAKVSQSSGVRQWLTQVSGYGVSAYRKLRNSPSEKGSESEEIYEFRERENSDEKYSISSSEPVVYDDEDILNLENGVREEDDLVPASYPYRIDLEERKGSGLPVVLQEQKGNWREGKYESPLPQPALQPIQDEKEEAKPEQVVAEQTKPWPKFFEWSRADWMRRIRRPLSVLTSVSSALLIGLGAMQESIVHEVLNSSLLAANAPTLIYIGVALFSFNICQNYLKFKRQDTCHAFLDLSTAQANLLKMRHDIPQNFKKDLAQIQQMANSLWHALDPKNKRFYRGNTDLWATVLHRDRQADGAMLAKICRRKHNFTLSQQEINQLLDIIAGLVVKDKYLQPLPKPYFDHFPKLKNTLIYGSLTLSVGFMLGVAFFSGNIVDLAMQFLNAPRHISHAFSLLMHHSLAYGFILSGSCVAGGLADFARSWAAERPNQHTVTSYLRFSERPENNGGRAATVNNFQPIVEPGSNKLLVLNALDLPPQWRGIKPWLKAQAKAIFWLPFTSLLPHISSRVLHVVNASSVGLMIGLVASPPLFGSSLLVNSIVAFIVPQLLVKGWRGAESFSQQSPVPRSIEHPLLNRANRDASLQFLERDLLGEIKQVRPRASSYVLMMPSIFPNENKQPEPALRVSFEDLQVPPPDRKKVKFSEHQEEIDLISQKILGDNKKSLPYSQSFSAPHSRTEAVRVPRSSTFLGIGKRENKAQPPEIPLQDFSSEENKNRV